MTFINIIMLLKKIKIRCSLWNKVLKRLKIVTNYPFLKLFLNRLANNIIKLIFLSDYNDFTNAFKIYKKNSRKITPIVSENFNVFLELPLKIVTRNYFYKIIPINWYGRKIGVSKFKIKEMSSMYIFTLFYCLFEKILLNKKRR